MDCIIFIERNRMWTASYSFQHVTDEMGQG